MLQDKFLKEQDQEAVQFYLEHKDKSFEFPIIPNTIDLSDGVRVCKWYIDQMLESNIGWLNLSLQTVNDPSYSHLPWDYAGRIECDKLYNRYKGKETALNINNHWTRATEEAPASKAFWWKCVPSEKYNFIRYNVVEPLSTQSPRIDKEFDGESTYDLIDDGVTIHMAMQRPGFDCKLVVEDCGIVPMNEGSVYLLNPRLKYAYLNTSETTKSHSFIASGRLGLQFQRFCDLIARSYSIQKDLQTK